MMEKFLSVYTSRHPRLVRGSGRPSGRLVSHETRGRATGSPHKAGMTMVFALCFLIAVTIPVHAQQSPSPQAVLMVAKAAGQCEVLFSMVDYQKKNNIKGGNEYVAQFWAAQSAQLNMTVEQMADRCNKSIAAYDKLLDAAAPKQESPANGNE
jgi:hypothetical protein